MKFIESAVLLLCLLLLASCTANLGNDSAESHTEETEISDELEEILAKNDESSSETETEAETETETEIDEKPTEEAAPIEVDEEHRALYFTSRTDSAYGERDTEYVRENKILGALIVDDSDYSLTFCVNRAKVENPYSDSNYYVWVDNCLHPLSEDCMNGGAAVFTTEEESYSLDGAETFAGKTADGADYCFYKTAGEGDEAARYYGFIDMGREKMAALMFADDGEHSWEEYYKPIIDKAYIFNPENGQRLTYVRYITGSDEDGNIYNRYKVSFNLPDTWDMDYSVGGDLPRTLDGRYSTKRFEICGLISPEETDESDIKYEGVMPVYDNVSSGETARGYEYTLKTRNSTSEGEINLSVKWHHIWLKTPDTGEEYYLRFLTYGDDEADYYEKYCLPVLDSILI